MRANFMQVIELLGLISSELEQNQNGGGTAIPKILGSLRNVGNGYWKNKTEVAE